MAVRDESPLRRVWTALGAGLVAGVAMGVVLHVWTSLLPAIGAIVGVPTALGGWAVHLTLSVLFAGVFVVSLSATPVTDEVRLASDTTMLGLVYGALVALVSWGVVVPLALSAGATVPGGTAPTVVDGAAVGVALGLAHLLYGLVLGLLVGVGLQPSPRLRAIRAGV